MSSPLLPYSNFEDDFPFDGYWKGQDFDESSIFGEEHPQLSDQPYFDESQYWKEFGDHFGNPFSEDIEKQNSFDPLFEAEPESDGYFHTPKTEPFQVKEVLVQGRPAQSNPMGMQNSNTEDSSNQIYVENSGSRDLKEYKFNTLDANATQLIGVIDQLFFTIEELKQILAADYNVMILQQNKIQKLELIIEQQHQYINQLYQQNMGCQIHCSELSNKIDALQRERNSSLQTLYPSQFQSQIFGYGHLGYYYSD